MDPIYSSIQDDQLQLLTGGTVIAATGNGTALDMGDGYAPPLGGQPMQVMIPINAIKTSATNETYSFKLQDSPDNSTWTDRSPAVAATAIGPILLQGFIQAEFVRVSYTLGGTAPSITVGDAYLNPIVVR